MVRLFGYFCCALFLLITSLSCDSTETPPIVPPPDLRKITLSVEDVSCTEVWLSIKADSITFPSEIILLKDTVAQTINLCCSDTTLYIDSLLPNKPYNYKAILTADTTIKSETVTAQTLDTTSHNFSWQSWTFGEHSSSVLYDVAIIDENNIWAVGEIYMNDSLGNPDSKLYNLIKWNGTEWKQERIYFTNSQGQSFLATMKSIFAFDANDIWIGQDQLIHWDGSDYIEYELSDEVFQSWVNKIWGTSSEDLYVVGNTGNIAHYSGPSGGWQKIESGTDLNIYDIWGDVNQQTGEYEIILLASDHVSTNGTKLFLINNSSSIEISSEGLPLSMNSLWFKSNRFYMAVGDGYYTTKQLGNGWIRDYTIPFFYKTTIRGINYNDIFLAGTFGLLMHNNGVEWKSYQYTVTTSEDFFSKVSLSNNIICAVGARNNNAVIYIGKR